MVREKLSKWVREDYERHKRTTSASVPAPTEAKPAAKEPAGAPAPKQPPSAADSDKAKAAKDEQKEAKVKAVPKPKAAEQQKQGLFARLVARFVRAVCWPPSLPDSHCPSSTPLPPTPYPDAVTSPPPPGAHYRSSQATPHSAVGSVGFHNAVCAVSALLVSHRLCCARASTRRRARATAARAATREAASTAATARRRMVHRSPPSHREHTGAPFGCDSTGKPAQGCRSPTGATQRTHLRRRRGLRPCGGTCCWPVVAECLTVRMYCVVACARRRSLSAMATAWPSRVPPTATRVTTKARARAIAIQRPPTATSWLPWGWRRTAASPPSSSRAPCTCSARPPPSERLPRRPETGDVRGRRVGCLSPKVRRGKVWKEREGALPSA